MTYLDYLNAFNMWLESNALAASSQLLYFKLLNVFNRAGWPEFVQVDNRRLMSMIGTETEKTAIRARDALIEAGLMAYQKGRKGSPNRYFLEKIYCKNYSVCDRENDRENDSVCDRENDRENDSHIKTKKKIKNIPPCKSPQGDARPEKRKYGQYGWVRLTAEEYARLIADLGEEEAARCIRYVDESAQANGNKNKWKDWNLVLRKCHAQRWGLSGKPDKAIQNSSVNLGALEAAMNRLYEGGAG